MQPLDVCVCVCVQNQAFERFWGLQNLHSWSPFLPILLSPHPVVKEKIIFLYDTLMTQIRIMYDILAF